jgi:sulfur-oxidizing protein SoxY
MANRVLKLRRRLLIGAGLAGASPLLRAQAGWPPIPALTTLLTGRTLQPGRVTLEIPKLADNGNSVPLTVTVDSPMSERDRVVAIHLFSERNPRPRMASIALGPDVGRAQIATRVRLAGTQNIVVVAEMADGALWGAMTEVIVTQSACTDDI